MKRLILISILALLSPLAKAEPNSDMIKYRNYLPKQIHEMTDEQRRKVPMTYLFAADNGGLGGEIILSFQLSQLMYPAVSDYTAAIKLFQKDLGENQTGVLTVGQIRDLEYRSSMRQLKPISLYQQELKALKNNDIATVSGTMTMLDEKIAYPINLTKIKCVKAASYCEQTMTSVEIPTDNSWVYQFTLHVDDPVYYKVISWDDDSIQAVPYDNDKSACRTTNVTLNFAAKEFFETTSNTGRECDFLGKKLPKLVKPRISQIVDGTNIIKEAFGDINKTTYNYVSSEFRARVDAELEKLKALEEKK